MPSPAPVFGVAKSSAQLLDTVESSDGIRRIRVTFIRPRAKMGETFIELAGGMDKLNAKARPAFAEKKYNLPAIRRPTPLPQSLRTTCRSS